MAPERVLVTGVSGFIALSITKKLLEEGKYQVRGTVRSVSKEAKIKPIKELVKDAKYPIELVEADLDKDEGWDAAVKDCTYVLHLASPFVLVSKSNEDAIVSSAVNGATRVLQACSRSEMVKRVVLTSSMVAVSYGHESSLPKDYLYTEADWSNESTIFGYNKSKTLAEKAAWDFMAKNKEDSSKHQFELATVCPSMVEGAYLGDAPGTSVSFIRDMLNGKFPFLPDIYMGFVDVKTVVDVHLAAMTSPNAAGQRYCTTERTLSMLDVAKLLNQEFGPQGLRISERVAPYFLAKILSYFDSGVAEVIDGWGYPRLMSHEKATKELGVEFLEAPKAIIETAYCLIERGEVPKPPKYSKLS